MKTSERYKRVLRLIRSGVLTNPEGDKVYRNGKLLKARLTEEEQKGSYRQARWTLEISLGTVDGKRIKLTILRSRLIWMIEHQRLIPRGFEIHHKDLDRFNDNADNLICVSSLDHAKLHNQPLDF